MSLLNFVGGLSAGYQGFRQGVEDVKQAEQRDQDRAFQLEQRELQRANMRRLQDEQRRADKLRDDLAAVPLTKEVQTAPEIPNDDEGNPMPGVSRTVPTSTQERLRAAAGAYKSAGDVGKAIELLGAADKESLAQSSRRLAQLQAAAGSMTPLQLAQQAAKLYDGDSLPGRVKDIRENPDGSISATFENADTGDRIPRTFKSSKEILDSLQAYYDPQNYAALVRANQELAQKRAEKLSELQNDPSKRFQRVGNSIFDAQTQTFKQGPVQPGFEYIGDGADGQPMYRRMATPGVATRSGDGARSGKPEKTEFDVGRELLSDALIKTKGSDAGSAVYVRAMDIYGRLMTENKMPGAMAARIAERIATDPAAVKPDIDLRTGRISNVYQDEDTGNAYVIRPDVGTALNVPKTPDGKPALDANQLQEGAVNLLAAIEADQPGLAAQYQAAANDPTGRARAALEAQIRQQALRAAASAPGWERLDERQRAGIIDKVMQAEAPNIQSRLDLIKNFGPKPKQDRQASQPAQGGLMGAVGGLFRRAGEMGVDYFGNTPQAAAARQQLQQKVRDAASGGQPLTETEKLRARQLGFTN